MAKKAMGWKTPKGSRKVETSKPASKAPAKKVETKETKSKGYKGYKSKFAMNQDGQIKAKKPGWRIAENGNRYYEARPNRSDENRKKKPYLETGGGVEKPKRRKFLLYTNPNNLTNRAYVAIGEDVKDVLRSSREYKDSYTILYKGTGTNEDLQKAKSLFSNYTFGNEEIMATGGGVGKMARGGYLEGREEYEGYKYLIWYRAPKGYSVSGDELFTKKLFDNENVYFDSYEDAKEHAEISIRSMLLDKEEMAKGGGVGNGFESKQLDVYGDYYKFQINGKSFTLIAPHIYSDSFAKDVPIAKGSIDSKGFRVTSVKKFDVVIALQDMIISLGKEDKDGYTLKTNNDYIHLTIDEGEDDKDGRQDIYYGDKLVAQNNWDGGETLQKGTMDKDLAIKVIYDIMDTHSKMKRGGGVEDFDSNIHMAWSTTKKITDDIRSFIFESYEAAGDELAEDVIAAIEQGIELAKMDMR